MSVRPPPPFRATYRLQMHGGFRLRDETGTIRVFPRGATWAVSDRFSEASGIAGEEAPGLGIPLKFVATVHPAP